MAPLVSVLMPVYNAGKFLHDAVQSVLCQTVGDLELIVVDDGSTDNGLELLREFSDPRIRLVRHDKNRGLAAARNTCLDAASGEYVAWLDADDFCHRSRLQEQLKLFGRDSRLGLCGTWVRTFGRKQLHRWQYPVDSATLKSRMIFDDPFATSSVMVRRSVLKEHSAKFDESFPPAEDYDLWERLSHVTSLANVAKYLTNYRLHQKQTSSNLPDRQAAALW
jgi:glycosyltransferase involved in cell wall biosynthesis